MTSCGGRPACTCGNSDFAREMMSSVEAFPTFCTESRTDRWPSTRTMLVCGGKPSRTCATSRMWIGLPFAIRMGEIVQLLSPLGAGVDVDVVLIRADFLRARWQQQVLQAQRVHDIGG